MSVYDRWRKSRPTPGDEPCREHSKGRTTRRRLCDVPPGRDPS